MQVLPVFGHTVLQIGYFAKLKFIELSRLYTTRFNSINLSHVHSGMETVHFMFKANQARSIYHYKRLKIVVLKCNADIFFG